MIDQDYPEMKTTTHDENLANLRMRREIDSNFEDYDFNNYAEYAKMARWMWTMQRRYPHISKLLHIGRTHQDRSIQGMKVKENSCHRILDCTRHGQGGVGGF